MSYLEEAEKLEERAQSLRERHALQEEGERLIAVGALIVDTDADKVAKVTGLKKGCIDFSADHLDGSYKRGYQFVVRNWRMATPEEVANASAPKDVLSVSEIVTELQKIIPEENFRKQPEHATNEIVALEAKYRLNTVDVLTTLHNDSIADDDLDNWLDAYDTFCLFGGDEDDINQQENKASDEMKTNKPLEENRFIVRYRDEETLERLKAMDIISYLPALHEQLKFLFVNSAFTQEELEAMDGISDVHKPRVGKLCVDGTSE